MFQRFSLALVAASSVLEVYLRTRGNSIGGLSILALLVAGFAFRKQLLWRVRNRLLLSYVLFGVVPLALVYLLMALTLRLGVGPLGADRVRRAVDARIREVQAAVQDLEGMPPATRSCLRERLLARIPRLGLIIESDGKTPADPSNGPFRQAPAWVEPGFQGLIEVGDHLYIAARTNSVFAFFPLTLEELNALTGEAIHVAAIAMGSDDLLVKTDSNGHGVTIIRRGVTRVVEPRLGPSRGFWDIVGVGVVPWSAPSETKRKNQIALATFTRPSILFQGVLPKGIAYGLRQIFLGIMSVLVIVELISLVWSVVLTRTITRSVDDLYAGTQRVSKAEFSMPIPERGEHQLSELAGSFNAMTTQVVRLLREERKKEKLESELEIAREVQNRLFPRTVPKLRSLELAGVCIPGRYVSGDYYDFVRLDARWIAIALGDVSGKGVSAALLMASIQSALHAQLKFHSGATSPVISTAALMELLSQQLYENTPPEKYATFFCSFYDDETGRLTYTNAGHLKPILVRAGKPSVLEGDGMPAGLFPNVRYEQQEIQLEPSDLVAVFSDGIPEAENQEGREFGEDGLMALLAENANKPIGEIIRIVTQRVDNWAADPDARDDTTIVLARRI
jgi:sigma-B regulation protein RsbU (phosphoserine phosphatase)